jgi:hypothetical protein
VTLYPSGDKVRDLRDVEVSVIRSSLVRLWKLLAPWKALLSLILAFASVILAIYWAERSSTKEVETKYASRPKTGEHFWKKFAMAAIVRPSTVRPGKWNGIVLGLDP